MTDTSFQRAIENAPFPHDTSGRYGGWLTDMIRRRAYEKYEARRNQSGNPEEDWLQAERELKHHFGI